MSPSELPGWTAQFQPIDMRGATISQLGEQVAGIAARVRQTKTEGLLIIGAVALGLLVLGGQK